MKKMLVMTVLMTTLGYATLASAEMSNERKGEGIGAALGALTAPIPGHGSWVSPEDTAQHMEDMTKSFGAAGKEMDDKKKAAESYRKTHMHLDR